MFSVRVLSALAAATFIGIVSAQSKVVSIPTPTATLPAKDLVVVGCFETVVPLEDHGKGLFMTEGSCQQICLGLDKPVLGLTNGTNCACGDLLPPKESKVDLDKCNTPCEGYLEHKCGGGGKYLVMLTGQTLNEVPNYEVSISSSSTSKAASQQTAASSSPIGGISASQIATNAPNKSSSNIAGIAAGVVVGVVALAGVFAGVFFYLRHKRRREIEEEHRRREVVSSFVAGGKLHTSNSSMTDSRLDPEFTSRRQSNGSIADNEDYSRRILKVTNV